MAGAATVAGGREPTSSGARARGVGRLESVTAGGKWGKRKRVAWGGFLWAREGGTAIGSSGVVGRSRVGTWRGTREARSSKKTPRESKRLSSSRQMVIRVCRAPLISFLCREGPMRGRPKGTTTQLLT
uniref:Uncharacterized protein n=1 Tax=Oryza nivara TaxID=4536 RepID=A0A0E0I8V5_ORYNI